MLPDILKSVSLQQKPLPSVLAQLGMQANMYFTVTSIKYNVQVMYLCFCFFLKTQIREPVSLETAEFPCRKNGVCNQKNNPSQASVARILVFKAE